MVASRLVLGSSATRFICKPTSPSPLASTYISPILQIQHTFQLKIPAMAGELPASIFKPAEPCESFARGECDNKSCAGNYREIDPALRDR
jgi:hypothetical protein